MLILGVITSTAWLSFDGIVRMKETTQATERSTSTARVSMQRISRELRGAFLTRNPSPTSAYLTMFRGQDDNERDRLDFNSFSHTRMYRESKEADSTEIGYYLEPEPDGSGLFVLLHREAPRVDGQPDQGGVVEVMARGVVSFNLRYYDHVKAEWSDYWDSLKIEHNLRLPKAVEVSLILVDEEGFEHPYVTTVELPMFRTLGNTGPIPDVQD